MSAWTCRAQSLISAHYKKEELFTDDTLGRFTEDCLKPSIFVFSRGDGSVTLSPAVVCSTSTSPLFSLLMEQLLLGHLGASMLLRHTPVHRANMKYSGIKTTSVFQSFCVKCLGFSWPPLIVFQGVIIFSLFEAPPVLLVHFSSLGSLSFPPLSTNSGYWHWLKQMINFINPDSLTQQVAPLELFYTLLTPVPPLHCKNNLGSKCFYTFYSSARTKQKHHS